MLHHPRRLPALALGALAAWLVASVAAPASLAPGTLAGLDGAENHLDHAERWLALPPLQGATYAVGDLLCHQKQHRSLHVNGNQLPVDERMTAIFAAAAPGLALTLRLPVGPYVGRSLDALLGRNRPPRTAARWWGLVVTLALLPAAADVAWENLLLHESSRPVRLATGTLAGVAGGLVLGAFLTSFDHVFGRRIIGQRRAEG